MNHQKHYYIYWGLAKPPFDKAPNPEMYFDLHRSVDHAVSEAIFTIEEGNACLVVIVGDAGIGKTMAIRVVIDSLEQEFFRIAYVTDPNIRFCQLLQEIIEQLSGELCAESRRERILEVFNQLLLKTQTEGKKVLIFIDRAGAMKPSTLESLRLLTDMQGDNENLFTIILAGRPELARRLEHPTCAGLFQRIGVSCHLTTIESCDLMRDYIEHRLECAGSSRALFSDEAYDVIWEYSKNGVPRLINKIAKLALQAGQMQGLQRIDAGIVRHIGARLAHAHKATRPERHKRGEGVGKMANEKLGTLTRREEPVSSIPLRPEAPLTPVGEPLRHARAAGDTEECAGQGGAAADQRGRSPLVTDIIKFSEHIYPRVKDLPADQRLKLAGQLATEVLKCHPHLIQHLGATDDPVPAWTILRNIIIRLLEQHLVNDPPPVSHA